MNWVVAQRPVWTQEACTTEYADELMSEQLMSEQEAETSLLVPNFPSKTWPDLPSFPVKTWPSFTNPSRNNETLKTSTNEEAESASKGGYLTGAGLPHMGFPGYRRKHPGPMYASRRHGYHECHSPRDYPKGTARYKKMRELHDVLGFVVNVHDATNFDVDLNLPDTTAYLDVIANHYSYYEMSANFSDHPDLASLTQTRPLQGITYRCRLKGVGINMSSDKEHLWKSNQMCITIKQLIDRTDGWVTCHLYDIDVYKRLLIEIIVHTSTGPVNLRDFILDKTQYDTHPIFYPYTNK